MKIFSVSLRMLNKLFKHNYALFIIISITAFLLDYFGVFIFLNEWSFERNFHHFLCDDMTTEQIITSFNYIHNPVEKCQEEKDLSLVFLIKSAVPHADRRAVIRRTWGNEQRFPHVLIRRIFILGETEEEHLRQNVHMEVAQHKDIVQADFMDAYYNNTLKSLLGMRWAVENCANSKFYMLVDDDYYVSPKNLIRFIAHPGCYPSKDGIFGYDEDYKELYAGFVYETRPLRARYDKWFVDLAEYPFNKWPPYISAGAFVLSRDTLRRLFKESLQTRLFRFDDIFLSIVAYKSNITLTHCGLFYIERPLSMSEFKYAVASHGFSNPQELEQKWQDCRAAAIA